MHVSSMLVVVEEHITVLNVPDRLEISLSGIPLGVISPSVPMQCNAKRCEMRQ